MLWAGCSTGYPHIYLKSKIFLFSDFYFILLRCIGLQPNVLGWGEKGTRCESWTLPDAVSSATSFFATCIATVCNGWEGRKKVE